MVTADNLNLDVLELIFNHISRNDLVAVSSVSKSFLAGVIPRLYAIVSFTARHVKRYRPEGGMLSPFLTLCNHPDLAIHVRYIDIHCLPFIAVGQVHPSFLAETSNTLKICRNLKSFVCSQKILPALLSSLEGKERLQDVHIIAALTSTQAVMLQKITTLYSLTLDRPTWNVIDSLPRWAQSLQRTLVHLTIYMSQDVNDTVLEALLPTLPHLRGLHVIGCPKASHLVVVKAAALHAPLLKELSFTIFEITTQSNLFSSATVPLPSLRHLAIDVRPASDAIALAISSIFISIPSLSTLLLKFSDRQFPICNSIIDTIPPYGVATVPLQRLSLIDCAVSMDAVRRICSRCKDVERLELPLPIREIRNFTATISCLEELHTLIDVGDAHANHGPRASLKKGDVNLMMRMCGNLSKVVSDGRMWTADRTHYGTVITPLRYKDDTTRHWFSPLKADLYPN